MIEVINGLEISYREKSTDMGVIREVFHEDVYNINSIPINSTVIDIGSHIGTFALRCAFERKCTVYAYEPCVDNYKLLTDNIHVNNLDAKIRAFNMAVSDNDGVREFFVDPYHYSGSSFYLKSFAEQKKHDRPFQEVKVECITLKQIFDKNNITHCDILKLDCEGEEKAILLDSICVLPKVHKIILEHHNLSDGKKIAKYLSNNGFEVFSNNQFQAEGGILIALKYNDC